ncbi:family 20 glycosylhydrolase [Actinoplanes sp. TBRC 11911]|uniref:beta-N-acetylhexosaminidase n=1 Tax=Actinoplanes sp. TBRC 11911 TaxID=2729386 RepID=UPI00145E63DF|nr:beta-N-acetylhexosaminidase [Actinoplanes sp. TBRC 11911]NMO55536.1 family 20 glycosylhydrolase [Actinoplanes sp. TBRC 11911]
MRQLVDVIPLPASVRPDPAANFTLTTGVSVSAAPELADLAVHLAELLRRATGFPVPLRTNGPIRILLEGSDKNFVAGSGRNPDQERRTGAYRLDISTDGVTLRAADQEGLFAGIQTIRQLLPEPMANKGGITEISESGEQHPAATHALPGGRIDDAPRFPYRGTMLDLARHFYPLPDLKRYIDTIAQLKINHLHLHLTDDQGWRLEIPSWPKLTEVSGGAGTGVDGAGPGFLSTADYTDLVAYAKGRFVTIVPEIDMPGHVNAAQRAYTDLTTDQKPVPQRTDKTVGYSSLAANQENTYEFVEDVIREVAAITPGPYLHIGGDEAFSTPPDDYQTFMSRVLPLIGKYGKRAIGWHEMTAVELPADAIPQYWRIEATHDGIKRAAAAGHQVIMSPADHTYLDMKYVEETTLGLDWAGFLDVRRAYDWDPADRLPGVGEESLLGVEAPLWSETLRSLADVEFMAFPRLAAIAEVAWTPRAGRDWESFRARLTSFAPRWTAQGVNFNINWE